MQNSLCLSLYTSFHFVYFCLLCLQSVKITYLCAIFYIKKCHNFMCFESLEANVLFSKAIRLFVNICNLILSPYMNIIQHFITIVNNTRMFSMKL